MNSRFASNLSPRGGYNGTFLTRQASPDRSRPLGSFNTYQASPPRQASPSSFALYRTRQASPNRMSLRQTAPGMYSPRNALGMQSPRLSRASSPIGSNRDVLVASPIRTHSNPRTLLPTSSVQMNSYDRSRQASPVRSPVRYRRASPNETDMRNLEYGMSRLRISSPRRDDGSVLVGVPMR